MKTIDLESAKEYITIPFSLKGHDFKLAIIKGRVVPQGKQTEFKAMSDNVIKSNEWGTLLLTKETFKGLRKIFNAVIID